LFFQHITIKFRFQSVKKKKTNGPAHIIVFFFQTKTDNHQLPTNAGGEVSYEKLVQLTLLPHFFRELPDSISVRPRKSPNFQASRIERKTTPVFLLLLFYQLIFSIKRRRSDKKQVFFFYHTES
jgi:hypothetical protein